MSAQSQVAATLGQVARRLQGGGGDGGGGERPPARGRLARRRMYPRARGRRHDAPVSSWRPWTARSTSTLEHADGRGVQARRRARRGQARVSSTGARPSVSPRAPALSRSLAVARIDDIESDAPRRTRVSRRLAARFATRFRRVARADDASEPPARRSRSTADALRAGVLDDAIADDYLVVRLAGAPAPPLPLAPTMTHAGDGDGRHRPCATRRRSGDAPLTSTTCNTCGTAKAPSIGGTAFSIRRSRAHAAAAAHRSRSTFAGRRSASARLRRHAPGPAAPDPRRRDLRARVPRAAAARSCSRSIDGTGAPVRRGAAVEARCPCSTIDGSPPAAARTLHRAPSAARRASTGRASPGSTALHRTLRPEELWRSRGDLVASGVDGGPRARPRRARSSAARYGCRARTPGCSDDASADTVRDLDACPPSPRTHGRHEVVELRGDDQRVRGVFRASRGRARTRGRRRALARR